MCNCTPEIRTPWCGKKGCEWPSDPNGLPQIINHPAMPKVTPKEYIEDEDGWISVEQRMPRDFEEVMFYYTIDEHKKDIVCGHFAKGIWHICYLYHSIRLNDTVKVKFWQPLPDYPKDI